MKTPLMKKLNVAMALQWFIFMPVILPLCVVFGAIQGVFNMVEKVAGRMLIDIASSTDVA